MKTGGEIVVRPKNADVEFVYFLRELVRNNRLTGAAERAARLASAGGLGNLTAGQLGRLDIALKPFIHRQCVTCGARIPWSEMYQAIEFGTCRLCSTDD